MAFHNRTPAALPTGNPTLIATVFTVAVALASASGCATATGADGSDGAGARAPVFSVQAFPSDHLDEVGRSPLPIVRACEDERIEVALADGDDDRCAHEIAVAAATTFLYVGHGANGQGMSVATYDATYALDDALEDEEFERMLRRADAAPRDGLLERHEALELERRVAKFVEGR